MRIGLLLLILGCGLGLARADDPDPVPPPLAQRWDVEKSLAGQADLIVVAAVVPAQSDLKARRLTLKITQMLAGQKLDTAVLRYGPQQEEQIAPFLKGKSALCYLQRARDTYIPVTVPGQVASSPPKRRPACANSPTPSPSR